MRIMEDEYELVPMNPIRKIERRLERMERSGTGQETIHELVEVVRANQHVIDDIVKMNSDMMNKVSELVGKVNAMTDKVTDFLERLEVSGEKEGETSEKEDYTRRLEEKLSKLEKKLNAVILSGTPMRRQSPIMR